MEIVHHFGLKLSSDAERQEFAAIGIDLQVGDRVPGGSIITSFEIGERDPRWENARRVAAKFQITQFSRTRFVQSEFEGAKSLCMFAASQRGYPEPTEKCGFLAATFDLSEYCGKCGIGCRQIRPFRVKSMPVLKRSILQLNWIFDEYFLARDVWTTVFEPLGIDCWPVLLHKSGEEIGSVVQLKISHHADLNLSESKTAACSTCGRMKTTMSLKGFSPEPATIPAPIFKSTQSFGSDASAFNRVLVSAPLYKKIKKDHLRGVEFCPCGPA